jgi:spore maturation protein CgeB
VKEQIGVWTRAKVAISVSNFNTIPRYYSDRQLIAIASGTPVVCYHVPELEKEFTDGVDCVFFHETEELVAHVIELLANPEKRARIGAAGRATALRDHTWFSRIFQVLPDIERLHADLVSGRAA